MAGEATALRVLERVALQVADPTTKLCRGLARDARRKPVGSTSRQAVAWSVLGLVHRELGRRRVSNEDEVHRTIVRALATASRPADGKPSIENLRAYLEEHGRQRRRMLRLLDRALGEVPMVRPNGRVG